MAKTGIHIKRANVGAVEAHNERTKEYLDSLSKANRTLYFFPELTSNNSSWVNPRYGGKTCQELFDDRLTLYGEKHRTKDGNPKKPILEDRKRVNKKTGKEYTVAGWSPIREGCAPIKEGTRLKDFQPVLDWARENGLDVIRIDLHHDEGHEYLTKGGKERKLNRHAHIVFDWVNPESGETVKLNESKMSELQTILANALGMERGESKELTGMEHIPHVEFREKKAQESLLSLVVGNDTIRAINERLKKDKALLEANKEHLSIQSSQIKKEIEEMNLTLDSLKEEANQYRTAVAFLNEVKKFLGPDLEKPSGFYKFTSEARQQFYDTIPDLPLGIIVDNIRISTEKMKNEHCTYTGHVMSGRINGYQTEPREVNSYQIEDCCRDSRGNSAIISKEKLFILVFYDLIRSFAVAMWNNLIELKSSIGQSRGQKI